MLYTIMNNNKLFFIGRGVEFKDDDYETPSSALEDLLPYLEKNKIIYDPFYCNGTVIEEWEKLGYTCINEKKDAFNREHPDFDYLISNIPFSCKEKCFKLGFLLNKPFIFLIPLNSLGSQWIKKYWDKLQFIIPRRRIAFTKKNHTTKNVAYFDCVWVCYKINLDKLIVNTI